MNCPKCGEEMKKIPKYKVWACRNPDCEDPHWATDGPKSIFGGR